MKENKYDDNIFFQKYSQMSRSQQGLAGAVQTKGTVLLVCFQCVDTLVLVLKHAEGMSLRCDVICALAYCGRHESSHIVKAHADLALWEFLGSHRFNEIQQDNNL